MIRLFILCWLTVFVPNVLAGSLEIPLRVPFEPIRKALNAEIAASSDRPGVIFEEGPCNYLHFDEPALDARDGKLHFSGPGSAAFGLDFLGGCRGPAAWRGMMEFTLAARIDRGGKLHLRIVDSKLTDATGKKAALGFVWDLSKRYLHPRLEEFTYDLGASREALLAVLRTAAPPEHSPELALALAQMQVLEPRLEANDVIIPIVIEIPDAWQAAPPPETAPASPLTEEELAVLDQALQPWDAFLVYSIKQVALDSGTDIRLRRRLFTLLLESRYQLADILSGEAPPVKGDPLRELFIVAWNELRAILVDAQRDGVLDPSLLRYALFIDAGDALAALDHAAPGLGMQVSADALRRLARSLRPDEVADPLYFNEAIDPQLRRLFDVEELTEPLPAPAVEPALEPAAVSKTVEEIILPAAEPAFEPVVEPDPESAPASESVPIPSAAPAESTAPASPPEPEQSWLEWFISTAYAATEDPGNTAGPGSLPALDKWVPKQSELDAYELRLSEVLQQAAKAELQNAGLKAPHDQIYLSLVPTTALIESCWRQYVLKSGQVSYLRSVAGSVGIMQINQHVWRGFYDLDRLKWDTAYNIRVGAQILMRYVKDYAIPYANRSGDLNHIPRAAYSVYNAGPRAVGRFNKPNASTREQRVDQRLWTFYQGIATDRRAVDLSICGVKTTTAP